MSRDTEKLCATFARCIRTAYIKIKAPMKVAAKSGQFHNFLASFEIFRAFLNS